jgi:hypothetical protein
MKPRTSLRACPRLALACLLAACGSERHGSPAPVLLTEVTRHDRHVGLDGSAPDRAALGHVVSARVTDGGRHVVVLDFVSPFVKVFDGGGRFQAAFLEKGGGPGEARQPSALAVAGDSLVLVADGTQGLSLFDLAGGVRGHARVSGLLPLAAASACPGEWLLYGPRMERGSRLVATWLHRVRFVGTDSVEVRSMLPDSLPGRLPTGLAYGLVADGDGAVVRHTLGTRPRLLRLSCAGGEPRLLHEGEPLGTRGESPGGKRTVQTSLAPGMRAPGGVAAVEGGVVFAEKVYVDAGRSRLDLTLLGAGGERTLSLDGDYVLQDSRPGVGVLIGTSEPFPQVFLVKPADFIGMFPPR